MAEGASGKSKNCSTDWWLLQSCVREEKDQIHLLLTYNRARAIRKVGELQQYLHILLKCSQPGYSQYVAKLNRPRLDSLPCLQLFLS